MADIDDKKPSKPLGNASADEHSTAPEVEDAPETPVDSEVDEQQDDTEDAADDTPDEAAEDEPEQQEAPAEPAVVMKTSRWQRFKDGWVNWWASPRKRWWTIITIVVALVALFAVPFTRYNVVGLAMKAPVTVEVVDSKTGAPVSGADVHLGSQTAQTEADGKATLRVHAGSKTLDVSKKYYQGSKQSKLVALSGNNFKASLVALGRHVDIKIVNKITGKPVAGAIVTADGAKAKTKADGSVALVIPSGATTQSASVSLGGYNTASVTITAASDLAKNTFQITPAGKLYFLSNLSGKIDVVKTNLDGSNRQTVLAGTGSEDKYSTSLLASRDWKYLALLSKRSGQNASLYLIDTTNGDKLTTIDEGDASFTLIGWSGDRFIYEVNRNAVSNWQSNKQALKSFDPTTGHTLLLDQTQGVGSNGNLYGEQYFGSSYLMDNQVVYVKNWQAYGLNMLDGKTAELDTIGADGSAHRVIKSFAPDTYPNTYFYSTIQLQTNLYEPEGLYVAFSNTNKVDYYDYDDGKIAADSSLTDDTFSGDSYPTFLLSPSSNQTFWSDQRDGKNNLFVGDGDAKNQKTVASLSDYNSYGWYTDNYLLVSKNSSELYIMPANGGTPYKITDYYKPAINYNGYGGGYGGL